MVITVLLLLILFFAGLVNLYFYLLPSKKLYAWLQSVFLLKNLSSSASSTTKVSPYKEKSISNGNNKEELKRVFATFDKNGDGFITKQELKNSLQNIGIFMADKEIEEMVVKVDSNGDGLVDYEEFCFLCEFILGGEGNLTSAEEEEGDDNNNNGEGSLRDAFEVFDRDKDGLISVEELGLVLSSLGLKEGNKVEDCKAMIKKVDVDGDGMVNFVEFKKMMKTKNAKF